jgi:hypothetical protein
MMTEDGMEYCMHSSSCKGKGRQFSPSCFVRLPFGTIDWTTLYHQLGHGT